MQDLIQALIRLLKVKSLITVLITIGLLAGFISGRISNEQFMTVAAMVFTFYFARQSQQDTAADGKEQLKDTAAAPDTPDNAAQRESEE